jgi:hypothetical protein
VTLTKIRKATARNQQIHSSFLVRMRKEKEEAKSTPMLKVSIGDQIRRLLEQDTQSSEESSKKTNAILALAIINKYRTELRTTVRREAEEDVRKRLLEQLHRVDIDPHKLAVRWLTTYTSDWWDYLKRRTMLMKERAKSKGKKS